MTTLRHILNNRLAAFGGAVLLLILIVVLTAPLLPLADPDITEPAKRLQRPFKGSALLGTDHLGRDLLSRLIFGTRLSLAVGIVAALAAALIGSAIGIAAGFFGGRIDQFSDARHRYADGLSLHPPSPGNRRSAGPGPAERTSCGRHR